MPADSETRSPVIATIAVGAFAGLLSGLFGVGGGIIVVPALILILKLDPRRASGTSLGAVLPISISSLLTYWGHDNVDWTMALWLAIGAVGGAVYGTKLIHVLPRKVLGYLFAVVLFVTAVRLYIPTNADGRAEIAWIGAVVLIVIGFATGVLAGLLGIGGGVVMVPAMIVAFSELPVVAKGTSAAVILPTSIIGTWRNSISKNIDHRVAVIVGLSGVPTAILGGFVADYMSKDVSNALFATLVLIVAARMVRDLRAE